MNLPIISIAKKNLNITIKSKSTNELSPLIGMENQQEIPTMTPIKPSNNQKPISAIKVTTSPPLPNETFGEFYFQTMSGYSDGRTKINQDSSYMNISIKKTTNCSLFGVFDGHGTLGHKVSDFLKKHLTGSFNSARRLRKSV